MGITVIITGATGMVGEGILLECLENDAVEKVLMMNRKASPIKHTKLEELIVPNFMELDKYTDLLTGYGACFYCAGISSIGMDEAKYTHITFDVTLSVANKLVALNPNMVFNFVSGAYADGSEKGQIMWARVKGKTENELMKLPFKGEYNFRPGFMKPFKDQKNVKTFFKPIILIFPIFFPKQVLTLKQVGQAMINAVLNGYKKQVLEISDIKELALINN